MELIHECFLELVEFYLVDEGGDIPVVTISFNTGDNTCDQQQILFRLRTHISGVTKCVTNFLTLSQ